jgi:hypothetical protein
MSTSPSKTQPDSSLLREQVLLTLPLATLRLKARDTGMPDWLTARKESIVSFLKTKTGDQLPSSSRSDEVAPPHNKRRREEEDDMPDPRAAPPTPLSPARRSRLKVLCYSRGLASHLEEISTSFDARTKEIRTQFETMNGLVELWQDMQRTTLDRLRHLEELQGKLARTLEMAKGIEEMFLASTAKPESDPERSAISSDKPRKAPEASTHASDCEGSSQEEYYEASESNSSCSAITKCTD